MKRYFSSLLLLCFTWTIMAQTMRCKPPEQQWGQREIAFLLEKASDRVEARQLITIPVVVHVLWNREEENISEAQIHSQIETLNQDFQARNVEVATVPSNFVTALANVDIEFCLASIDPRGNASDGIERVFTTVANIGSNAARIKYASRGGADAWDSERYINFWVAKRSDGVLGEATSPESAPTEEQGLIIDYKAFGKIEAAVENAPYDLGRTATHELGHYFGLQHLWGSDFSCTTDDGLEDTPSQSETYNKECPAFSMLSCGNSDMYMNFMNYTDDACMAMFTNDQKALMLATIMEFRTALLEGAACTMTTSIPTISNPNLLKCYPNPATNRLWMELEPDISLPNTVFIYNSLGKLEQTLTLSSSKACLNTEDFATGVYIVVVPVGTKQWTKRFIISK